MKIDPRFEALWGQQEFEVPVPRDNLCIYARKFEEWLTPLIANVEMAGSIVAVNQGVILVARKYMEWYEVVPKDHRTQVGERGHTCIFHCFHAAMLKLKMIELSIQPPPISMPIPPPPQPSPQPPPPPPPPLQIAGIFLGEDDE